MLVTEDGQLNEALLRQYTNLNLSQNPDITRVSTGEEALHLASEQRNRFDLIINLASLSPDEAIEAIRTLLASRGAVE